MNCLLLLCGALLAIRVTANDRGWKSYRDPCPESCTLDSNSFEWNVYSNAARLAHCNQTMLIEMTIHNPIDDPNTQSPIYACSTQNGLSPAGSPSTSSCDESFEQTLVNFQMGSLGSVDSEVATAQSQVLDVINSTTAYLASSTNYAGSHIFSASQDAAAGLYVGDAIHNVGAADSILTAFEAVLSQGLGHQMILQHCGSTAKNTFGVAINMDGDLAAVQRHVRTWSQGGCASGFDQELQIPNSLLIAKPALQRSDALNARSSHCRTVRVASGDSCHSLATECGISGAKFTKYNPDPKLCSSLQPGQSVCCSPGSLPNNSPKTNADGSCHSYIVQPGDSCSTIAASHSISMADIEEYNSNTWGWMGCQKQNFKAGQKICLSSGTPPFPAPISNAVCGPQVPGTSEPDNGIEWKELNACPLYACCDTWGQCGVDPSFCTKKNSPTGAPGTEGCVAWCGYKLVNEPALVKNPPTPNWYKKVGYYEGWNLQRKCDTMEPNRIPTDYTHIHYAFGTIQPDFTTQINDKERHVFHDFVRMTRFKRIVTFGGWAFSTDPSTYMIFREGVKPANRGKLAQSVADFVNKHNLDGVDFDWEYPGAPDIPGIPPGSKEDGPNYLSFLKELRSILGLDKSISIAVPASYWYLRAFPLVEMTGVVDYFVFMTYDLSGIWDMGSKWSQPSCPQGNCLRSDVNLTQTRYDLEMISKVVAPARVMVGTTSYGRSFEMATPGCTGEMCRYTGPGIPGKCTQTKGFLSNAEIEQILQSKNEYSGAYHLFSADSDSDVLVYNNNQWVSYLSKTTKATRKFYYESLGFLGIADWAVDLASTWENLGCSAKAASSILMPYSQVWSDLNCDNAWQAAVGHWEQYEQTWDNKNLQFSEVISRYFNGPQYIRCSDLTSGNACGGDTAGSLKCSDFNSAAGYKIMSSLMLLENKYLSMYSGIQSTQGYLTDRTPKLCDTFAPHRSTRSTKLALDLVNLGISLFLSPYWNKVWKVPAKKAKWDDNLAVLKDWVNPAISQSFTISKDMIHSSTSISLADQNAITNSIGQITNQWQAVLTRTVSNMFNGSSASNEILYNLIKDGRALHETPLLTMDEWRNMFDTALFTILIPELWSLKSDYPFVWKTEIPCSNGQLPSRTKYWWYNYLGLPLDNFPWYCHDNLVYFLATPKTLPGGGWHASKAGYIAPLPGATQLDGKTWGPLSTDDIMLSCLRAYTQNGNQNGWSRANPQHSTALDAIIQHGTAAAGVWPFPVCSSNEAINNWYMMQRGVWSKNFPCN